MKTTFLGKYYYWIWADGIMKAKERFPDSNIYWKFMLMLAMIVSCGGFSMFFYAFFGRMIGLPWPQLNLFENAFIEKTTSALVFFMLPWFLMHYYLVFWKDKYQSFLPKYEYRKGKLFTNFFLGIIFIPLLLLIFGVIIAKM
jgi:hypothetical protein